MNRFVVRLLALWAMGLAGGAAWADPVIYSAPLAGSYESPANVSPGSGTVSVGYDAVANTLSVDLSFADLTGTTTVAHLHCCAGAGVNAGVAVGLTGFVSGVSSATYSALFDLSETSTYSAAFLSGPGGGTATGAASALGAALAAGQVYVNVHTTAFPGGEIRGDLTARSAQVPEPAGLALLAMALLALGLARRQHDGGGPPPRRQPASRPARD